MWETRILTYYQWECTPCQYFVESNLATASDSAISLLEIYLAEIPVQRHTDTVTKVFKATLFRTSKYWKQLDVHHQNCSLKIMVHSSYGILYNYLNQWSGSVCTITGIIFKHTTKQIHIYKMFEFSQCILFRKIYTYYFWNLKETTWCIQEEKNCLSYCVELLVWSLPLPRDQMEKGSAPASCSFRRLVKMIDSHLPAGTKKIRGSSHHFQLC